MYSSVSPSPLLIPSSVFFISAIVFFVLYCSCILCIVLVLTGSFFIFSNSLLKFCVHLFFSLIQLEFLFQCLELSGKLFISILLFFFLPGVLSCSFSWDKFLSSHFPYIFLSLCNQVKVNYGSLEGGSLYVSVSV